MTIAKLSGELSPDEVSLLTVILQKPETIANGQKALSDYIEIMESERQDKSSVDLQSLADTMRKKKSYTRDG